MDTTNFKLRHSISPYMGLPVIFGVVLIFVAYIGFAESDWGGLVAVLIIFAVLFSSTVIFGLRYRIWFSGNTINMQASTWNNRPNVTTINVSDITAVKKEISDTHTLVKLHRPFRRIAIYDQKHEKYVDVSLKHFVRKDIEKLLSEIHKQRPDIEIPTI